MSLICHSYFYNIILYGHNHVEHAEIFMTLFQELMFETDVESFFITNPDFSASYSKYNGEKCWDKYHAWYFSYANKLNVLEPPLYMILL